MWHRGRAILSAASEDEEHIEFHIDHVNHDMNEDPKKVRTQQMRQVNNSLIETQEKTTLTTWRRQKKLVGGIVDVLYSAL